jgi:hypothetical protein
MPGLRFLKAAGQQTSDLNTAAGGGTALMTVGKVVIVANLQFCPEKILTAKALKRLENAPNARKLPTASFLALTNSIFFVEC